MQSVIEGVCAGLTALGAGLFAKARGWGPLRRQQPPADRRRRRL